MDNKKQGTSEDGEADSQITRTMTIAERGVKTAEDLAAIMSSLISDIIAGRVTPVVANAACNASGKLLKVVELQCKYGTPTAIPGERTLKLTSKN